MKQKVVLISNFNGASIAQLALYKNENIDATLVQFHLRFRELIDQEYSMEYLYENAIDMD